MSGSVNSSVAKNILPVYILHTYQFVIIFEHSDTSFSNTDRLQMFMISPLLRQETEKSLFK